MIENEILDNFDLIDSDDVFLEATKGKRLANYFIDMLAYFVLSLLSGLTFGMMYELNGPNNAFLDFWIRDSLLNENITGYIFVIFYYTFSEYVFNGKTLGKLITKTRAVTLYNKRLTLKHAFLRSLCRMIPFEGISYLGSSAQGLHDKLPKTKVIIDEGWNDY